MFEGSGPPTHRLQHAEMKKMAAFSHRASTEKTVGAHGNGGTENASTCRYIFIIEYKDIHIFTIMHIVYNIVSH